MKSHEAVQKVIRLQSYGLIRLFGSGSQQLLDVLRNPPKGAETFALRILLVLTDKGKRKKTMIIRVRTQSSNYYFPIDFY